jgi:hypothetical protein
MIMRKLFLIFIFFCSGNHVIAQKKLKFSSQNYAGILEGSSGSALQLHSINGISYKTWFAGLGAGLDYYYHRSIPLFISVSKSLSGSKLPLYFTGDLGVNLPWTSNEIYFNTPGKYHSGLYAGTGLGYKFSMRNSNALLLNLGYNYKRLSETREVIVNCFIPPCPDYTEAYNYKLKRLSVRVGWTF